MQASLSQDTGSSSPTPGTVVAVLKTSAIGSPREPAVARTVAVTWTRSSASYALMVVIYHMDCYPFVMATILRMRCVWSGTAITGDGLTTFYLPQAETGMSAVVNTFFDSIKAYLAAGSTITIPDTGDLVDDATGELAGSWSDGSTSTVQTTGAGGFAAGVGARVKWSTQGVVNGRRVRGSTFLVPLSAAQYQSDGTLLDATKGVLQTAANTMNNAFSSGLLIWHRPVNGAGGSSHAVTSGEVPDKVSWLRSRRV